MPADPTKTLRLLFPQWQGGNNPSYHFGAQLLAWLAPSSDGPVEEVPVAKFDGTPLGVEDGITGRSVILDQARAARRLIDRHSPDRLIILGGDCLVDLAPFAYLNERYDGDLAVLWVDAHPDVATPDDMPNAHAMVMGNLLGEGDADLTACVPRPIKASNLMYAGLGATTPSETAFITRHGLLAATPGDLADTSAPVLDWFKSTGARHLAIHLDLDVLDPTRFRSLLFADPRPGADSYEGTAKGEMTMPQIVRLLNDVAAVAHVVGLGVTEHMPWDALALKTMLNDLPLIGRRD